jgi:hypothetical protein
MAEESGNKDLSIAAAPPTSMILEQFDLADDSKIIAALSKRVTQGFTYKANGKYGLSSAGTLWAAREFAKQGEVYRVTGFPKVEICPVDPDYINVYVAVQRFFVHPGTGQEIALDTTIGHKRMSRKAKRYKDDQSEEFEMIEDPEFITKAITKAERNGKLHLMPKDAVINLVAKATGQPAPNAAPAKGATSPPKSNPKPTTPPAGGAAAGSATPPPQDAKKPEEPKKEEPKKDEAKKEEPKKEEAKKPATPPADDGKPKMSLEVMVQKLDAVCKMVFNTQDGAVARQKLATLTGKASPADLTAEEIKKIGNAINAVAKKTATIEGNNIIRTSDKSVLWKGPELPPPPQADVAPAAGKEEEPLF